MLAKPVAFADVKYELPKTSDFSGSWENQWESRFSLEIQIMIWLYTEYFTPMSNPILFNPILMPQQTNNMTTVQLPCLNGTVLKYWALKVEGVIIKYSERAIPQWENNLGRRGGVGIGTIV